mmetsp:Transcript_2780/g.4314  ORF Transcript_2780/g.4314 Transcript_2780/m.4314 type:complete len:504 (+) Transcript_2780:62-1573(+)
MAIRVYKYTASNGQQEKPKYEFKAGDIFSVMVTPDEPLKVDIGPTCNVTITAITTETLQAKDGSGLYFADKHPRFAIPMFVKSSANHSASGLNLNCCGPNSFYLSAKLNSMFVFGSVVEKQQLQQQLPPRQQQEEPAKKKPKQDEAKVSSIVSQLKSKMPKDKSEQNENDSQSKPASSKVLESERSLNLQDFVLEEEREGETEKQTHNDDIGDDTTNDDIKMKENSTHSLSNKITGGLKNTEKRNSPKKADSVLDVWGSLVRKGTSEKSTSSLGSTKDPGKVMKKKKEKKGADNSVRTLATEEMSSVFDASNSPVSEDGTKSTIEPQELSKKQRKKLAKQKSKELAEALAIQNKHNQAMNTSKSKLASDPPGTRSGNKDAVGSKAVPLTKERRLKSGVVVKDILIGTGTSLKPGRKVSICYEGRFADGSKKVFDKNMNKKKPLTFRQGTGAVIAGLDQGVEGMRVGGEREITIPPELGYGKKGSGNVIPPDATLHFSVQVVGT